MSTKNTSYSFAAFLRGINVGGNNPIKMDALRAALEDAGFQNVRTVLASGNVVFETTSASESMLAKKIQTCVKDAFDKEIGVIVRSIDDLQKTVDSDPFRQVKVDSKTKFYVTFLSDQATNKLPVKMPPKDSGFTIVRAASREIFSYIVLSPGIQSTDLMSWLDKIYGKNVTTRTWNTIAKVLKAADC